MQYTNQFKSLQFESLRSLEAHRLSINEQQMNEYWQSKTYKEMEQTFTISDQFILSYLVQHFLQATLSSKQITTEAYFVMNSNQTAIYVYDCKIFRNHLYSKEENDFINGFLICYQEHQSLTEPIFQFLDPTRLIPGNWYLKVKESAILKIYSLLQSSKVKSKNQNDVVVMPQEHYYSFLTNWMNSYYGYTLETNISYFFKAIFCILQNQIFLQYFNTLNQNQKQERRYQRPIKSIAKPKNISQFTMIEQFPLGEGEIKWQTLKIPAFQLKYRVIEKETTYQCFRMADFQDYEQLTYNIEELTLEDQNILHGFEKIRVMEEEYRSRY